jgi:SnoaL-like domain
MSQAEPHRTLEDRLRTVEDTLAIYHLIASHPPAADTGADNYYRDVFMSDGVIDLGGGKAANGNEAIAAVVKTPEHQAAIAGGLCHFAGLPRVQLNGDTAVAISYLQVIAPNREAKPVELSGHGVSSGYRIHRLGANRWDLKRTNDGWKVARRAYRMLDGTDDARDLLRKAVSK